MRPLEAAVLVAVFMGMRYRFAGIVPPAHRVKARELLLPPGLLYVTD